MNSRTVRRWALGIAFAAAMAVAYGLGRRGSEPTPVQPAATTATSRTPEGARQPLYWYDPMTPSQHFDKPGRSPYMDMPLVPRYADTAEQGGQVSVSGSAAQVLGLRLGRVELTHEATRMRAVGAVVYDDELLRLVQPRADGTVVRLLVMAPEQSVRLGQPLAEVLVPTWLEAEQAYLSLMGADALTDPALRAAARQRLLALGVAEETIGNLERTREVSTMTTIRAPVDGVITELTARQGAAFSAGAPLFRLNGLATVWVNVQIPEAIISSAAVGSAVTLTAPAWPGAEFHGRVLALLPDVDPDTRTLTARVSVDNRGHRLVPGMFVSVVLVNRATVAALTVPTEAVIATGTRTVVIVRRPDGTFDGVNVQLGPESEGRSVILSGLVKGQLVVTSGQFLIDSEASLTSTLQRLQGAAGSGPGQAVVSQETRQ